MSPLMKTVESQFQHVTLRQVTASVDEVLDDVRKYRSYRKERDLPLMQTSVT